MKDSVLVTGGAGYIGTALINELLKKGYKVFCLDFLAYGKKPIEGFLKSDRFEFIDGL